MFRLRDVPGVQDLAGRVIRDLLRKTAPELPFLPTVPDERMGEELWAWTRPKEVVEIAPEELQKFLKGKVG